MKKETANTILFSLFAFLAGFGMGFSYAVNKIYSVALDMLARTDIDPVLLSEMVRQGLARMGL